MQTFDERLIEECLMYQEMFGHSAVINLMRIYEDLAAKKLKKGVTLFWKSKPTSSKNYQKFSRLHDFLTASSYPAKGYLQAQFYKGRHKEALPYISNLRSKHAEQGYLDYLEELKARGLQAKDVMNEIKDKDPIRQRLSDMCKRDCALIYTRFKQLKKVLTWDEFVKANLPHFSLAFHYTHPEFQVFKDAYYKAFEEFKDELGDFETACKTEEISKEELTTHYAQLRTLYKQEVKNNRKHVSILEYFEEHMDFFIAKWTVEGVEVVIAYIKERFPAKDYQYKEKNWQASLKKILAESSK